MALPALVLNDRQQFAPSLSDFVKEQWLTKVAVDIQYHVSMIEQLMVRSQIALLARSCLSFLMDSTRLMYLMKTTSSMLTSLNVRH